jgi:hypothetical protein
VQGIATVPTGVGGGVFAKPAARRFFQVEDSTNTGSRNLRKINMKADLNLVKKPWRIVRAISGRLRNPWIRKAILLCLYAGGFALSFILAYELRFDFAMEEEFKQQLLRDLPWILELFQSARFRAFISGVGIVLRDCHHSLVSLRRRRCAASWSHSHRLSHLISWVGRHAAWFSLVAGAIPCPSQFPSSPGPAGWDCRGRRCRGQFGA